MPNNEARIFFAVLAVSEQAAAAGLTPSLAMRLTDFKTGVKGEAGCSRCGGFRPCRVFKNVDPDRWPGANMILCLTCKEADLWV